MSFSEQLILVIVPIILPIVVGVVAYLVRSGIERLPANKRAFAASLVQTMVTAAEQSASVSGPTKKQDVLQAVQASLSHFKMSVPEQLLSNLIDETVYSLNQSKTGAVIVNQQSPMSTEQPKG